MHETASERRQSPRRRVLKGGTIWSPHRLTNTRCTIRDLSAGGACLVVPDPVSVPQEFELYFQDRSVRRCRVVWRNPARVGVAFRTTA
jgi:c-di-GMP-binding flagellar brake protein YcgR